MSVRRILSLAVLFIFSIFIILFASYYIERTSNLKGNVTQTFFNALNNPQANGEIENNDQKYNFTLPEHTYELNRTDDYITYLTIVSMNTVTASKGISDYYYDVLPNSGWEFVDQLGSGYIFTNGNINLISSSYRLMIGIEILTFSIDK